MSDPATLQAGQDWVYTKTCSRVVPGTSSTCNANTDMDITATYVWFCNPPGSSRVGAYKTCVQIGCIYSVYLRPKQLCMHAIICCRMCKSMSRCE